MGKGRQSSQCQSRQSSLAKTPTSLPATTSTLKSDPNIGYKIKVLLYDLRNITKDRASEQRTMNTVDELYISTPYFTFEEAAHIKSAVVDSNLVNNDDFSTALRGNIQQLTVEEAIHASLKGFFEKRKASGDARPCGPHGMAPIYEEIFGIPREELQDERFLSRLRRQGLA